MELAGSLRPAVTVDNYGHLIPGGYNEWIDRLDQPTSPQPNATQAQPERDVECVKSVQLLEKNGRLGGIRTPDPRFRKPSPCFEGI
jgi:hypothetical protein